MRQDLEALAVIEEGKGDPPLIFLHGMGSDSRSAFAPQIDHFARSRRAIAIDLPGHGANPPLPDRQARPPPWTALWHPVARRIRSLTQGPYILIGHSLGGLIALAIAGSSHPPLGVVLLDVPLLLPAAALLQTKRLAGLFSSDPQRIALREFAERSFFAPSTPDALKGEILRQLLGAPVTTLKQSLEAMASCDGEALVSGLRSPAMFISAGVPLDGARLSALYPNLSLVHLDETGHYCQLERPQRVNQLIQDFVLRFQTPAASSDTIVSPR